MEESSTDRATSSEPCSGRPNPFDDVIEPPSRKRQRVSSKESRSRSADKFMKTNPSLDDTLMPLAEIVSEPDSTISVSSCEAPEPISGQKSNKFTINLRTNHSSNYVLSSPSFPCTMTPYETFHEDHSTRISDKSESDAFSTGTPSSSPILVSSPQVELLPLEDSDLLRPDPPIALIEEEDDEVEDYLDIFFKFPYRAEGETLCHTLKRLLHLFQLDEVSTDEVFCRLGDWIDAYLLKVTCSNLFYENYIKNQEFWASLPEVIWALSHRQKYFGDFLRKSREGRLALTKIFCHFGQLAGRFVAIDLISINSHSAQNMDEPNLGSYPYLHALSHLLHKDESPHIGKNLEVHYQWNFDDDILQICDCFQANGGTIPALKKLIESQIYLLPMTAQNVEKITYPCRIVEILVRDAVVVCEEDREYISDPVTLDTAQKTVLMGYEFFLAISAGLETIIDKHITNLSHDAATTLLNCLSYILKSVLTLNNSHTQNIFKEKAKKYGTISLQDYSTVISVEWKFGILKKLITSAQMQLRVIGVTTMCTELLHLHHSSRGSEISSCPVLVYFAEYILEHKLVDYIVGIGSHPEIIHESGNIIGFLMVTKMYRPQQTDTIWQTVMICQDPRVVDAILRMLTHCHNLFDDENLLYLCRKITSFPFESFTPAMRELCHALFKQFMSKSNTEAGVPAPPYQLCVRLIRESSKVTVDNLISYSEIQAWAATRFRELLSSGPSSKDRKDIYRECLKDISLKTATAPGSICVIYTLLSPEGNTDLLNLTSDSELVTLFTDELESLVSDNNFSSFQLLRSTPAGQACRSLLLRIVKTAPSTITPELGERLWDALVGSKSQSSSERNIWWQTLNAAVKQTQRDNVFLTRCFQVYLPKLPPHCFTPGALEFAREAVFNWLKDVHHDILQDNAPFMSLALEQIWHMVLTASSNTIDGAAIKILVEIYLESSPILSVSCTKAQEIHLALIDRCLKQLKCAASKLKTLNHDISALSVEDIAFMDLEAQFKEQKIIFTRSLAVLREFLRAYHSKPHFSSPKANLRLFLEASDVIKGDPIVFKYQSFDGDNQTAVKSLTLGQQNTVESLLSSMHHVTGFQNFKIYCGGKEFSPDQHDVTRPLVEFDLKGLLLVKRCEDIDINSAPQEGNKTILELEIFKHFDDLWSYLSMHESVAQEIYYFLKGFPIYEQLSKCFSSNTSFLEIFPIGQPFKSLYAIHSLREYIGLPAQKKGLADEAKLSRAISLIVSAISDPTVLNSCSNSELNNALTLQILDCLILLLKEPIPPSSLSSLLNERLLDHLLNILSNSRKAQDPKANHVTSMSFEAIIECSIHDVQFWESALLHFQNSTLLRELLLENTQVLIRKSTAKLIIDKCSLYTNSPAQVSSTTLISKFWAIVSSFIPDAVRQYPEQCEQTLSVCYALFKRVAEISVDSLRLEDLVNEWGALLISHTSNENLDQLENIDMTSQGLGNLLQYATSVAKSTQRSLSCSHIGTELFRKHLFPKLSDTRGGVLSPKMPLLNSKTRSIIAETVFFLIKDDKVQYWEVLAIMESLLPYVPSQGRSPYSYDLGFLFERSKSIRSSTGYVGLRNPSNTCYLNSLLTQLFMNVPFRSFMLSALVADGAASQKLLSETQSLFSYMQYSFKRFVGPEKLASSIRTYDETQIDVTVQMDVDEFYNLLFDRWEGQILAPEAKKTFRSFYGGQLVQQVKSRECPHVSERLEPFSAIQCDIKGKSCLEESLQAYVDGEVMEGENRYKCSSCDKHVDAVKRACLKEIPDNLIFHLKRFDFNLRTLQRSKINDHFSFPTKIDMKPYKVEHLMDSSEAMPEDIFELVGILVHSGTAESGHYYSYIRERPSNHLQEKWVEFNDECVSPWDPTTMEGSCFGGPDLRGHTENSNILYDKTWSAYMLFYQRYSNISSQKIDSGQPTPIRLPISRHLSSLIATENELLIRKYCLYDPSYTSFTLKMLQNVRKVKCECEKTTRRLEKLALKVSLNHLDQVVTRTKDLPDFSTFMLYFQHLFQTSAECSRDYLDWLCKSCEALSQFLFKNPDQVVRNDIASLTLLALFKIKSDAPYAYGLLEFDESDDEQNNERTEILERTVSALKNLWDIFHTNFRAWPEYFGLLASIARIGTPEAAILLSGGFLHKTLDVITADPNLPLTAQYNKMLNTISKRGSAKAISYEAVISLLWHMMQICDNSLEPVDQREERIELALNGHPIPLTVYERNLLVQYWTRSNSNIVVEKLLQINQNEKATTSILINLLSWDDELDVQIRNAITGGIKRGLSSFSNRPFLRGAIIYCEHSKDPHGFQAMVTYVSKTASRLQNSDGKDFLGFFRDIFSVGTNSDLSDQEIYQFLLNQAPIWTPCLLTNYDQKVRQLTEEFIQEFIIGPWAEIEENISPESPVVKKSKFLRKLSQRLAMRCLEYLLENYIRPRQTAVRGTLTSIQAIIEACEETFEEDLPLGRRYFEQRISTIGALKKLTVEEADQEASDWDNSDGVYDGSSEPLDGTTEIGGCQLDEEQN